MPDENEGDALSKERHRLVGLLDYVRHMARLGQKAVLRVKQYGGLVLPEVVLKDRVGVRHDQEDDDGPIWLSVERLKRVAPPNVSAELASWLAVHNDPTREPAIETVLVATIPAEQAEREIENGTLAAEDVQAPLEGDDGEAEAQEETRDVIYRLERLPDVRAAVDAFIQGPWQRWAEEERPRRQTIAIYDELFSLRQALELEGADNPQELVWGIGVARWNTARGVIDRPLVEQLVEVDLDSASGTLRIRPRDVDPQFVMDPYFDIECDGVEEVYDYGRRFIAETTALADVTPFDPNTVQALLRRAATELDSQGSYLPDSPAEGYEARRIPEPGAQLTVSDVWVLFSRRRSEAPLIADLEKLKEAVEESPELPPSARVLVTEPSDEVPGAQGGAVSPDPVGGPRSAVPGGSQTLVAEPDSAEFFFPKPYNEAQESIIRKLATADGVVVQGPPGTGKTHTIANIVCHYMATGRRVLVTSKGEAALAVLREHLPEEVRVLAISLLTSEREGLKQLEVAVSTLANLATVMRPPELQRKVASLERRIRELRQSTAAVERELSTWARKHLSKMEIGGVGSVMPMEVAQRVCQESSKHAWFPDRLDPERSRTPEFTPDDIGELRAARRELGVDLSQHVDALPSPSDLPDEATIVAMHRDRLNARAADGRRESAELPLMSTAAPGSESRAEELLGSLKAVRRVLAGLSRDDAWLRPLFDAWCQDGADAPTASTFNRILAPLEEVVREREELVTHPVEFGEGVLGNPEVPSAVERGARGQRALPFFGLGQANLKTHLGRIRVEGRAPLAQADWQLVHRHLLWRGKVTTLVSRWNALREEHDLPQVSDEGLTTGLWFARALKAIQEAIGLAFEHRPLVLRELPVLFPAGIDPHATLRDQEACEHAIAALEHALERSRLSGGQQRIEELGEMLAAIEAPLAGQMVAFLEKRLGSSAEEDERVAAGWRTLISEIQRLKSLRAKFDSVHRITALIQQAGAPEWARRLRAEPVGDPDAADPLLPDTWQSAWEWSRLSRYLETIDGRKRIGELSATLIDNDRAMKRAFLQVVELRTHLGLNKRISDRVAAALTRFAEAIRRIGRGTGVRARRYRRDARAAMMQAYSAVPCWIMPTWRVSESLPAELGSFDLVIVDEASQSDVTALPALLRGAKVLVVGDDKQVSPTAAFIEERKILQLRHNFLEGQPFEELLLPGASLYTLAKAMFPRQTVLLREHFRCVEPIIRFSFQFYNEPLIPLRVPTALERIDPPLVDVLVKNGVRDRRKLNVPEAEGIVDEVERLVNDPAFESRSMGIISLVGGQQAHFIQQLLLERIGEELFERHRIACGDSATFQGKERDIMFVSMVECPQTQRAKTTLEFEQRYNVALSRARDRMYLFRSVEAESLRPDDLKSRVIRHFQDPMPNSRAAQHELVDLCESGFEREVFERLTGLDYRVTPQMGVGGYYIDLVVEGEEGRRLAIELDGDQYHPPEQWADDFRRQRILERVGWTFWRCWGSSFAMDPDACMNDLRRTLSEMRIEPIGGAANRGCWTEHRVLGEAVVQSAPAIEAGSEAADVLAAEVHDGASASSYDGAVALAVDAEGSDDEPVPGAFEDELYVEVGDQVQVVFQDAPDRKIAVLISDREHKPEEFIIHQSRPLAAALLGHNVDDEVEVQLEVGRARTAVIVRIDREHSEAPLVA